MAIILCLETTSTNCSVALAAFEAGFENSLNIKYCLDLKEDQSDSYGHGERLHVFIEEILERNQLTTKDLNAVAISKGPGSYTGLRIGVASAKGLCFALDIPLIAIDTLQSLTLQVPKPTNTIIPMIDARRMEVYTAVFQNQEKTVDTSAKILEEESFDELLSAGNVTVIGSGANKFQELNEDHTNIYIDCLPSALTMCDLAIQAYKKSDVVNDIAYFEPYYLKEFKSN
ncbi:tRNA threonylcarbamoyladenosine biosynthesis protein TsaB [Nonlabens sp. Hel1_33_55]|uniref:tRNA (adenosine(37)-N6)-threonylcarbamoyltransferase complex dimerization subunit type 1 TsaB n=1 Tax=Nonlabens sp. Hel1_33_55 TaxID=1336802 RepID=UPI000875EDE7|nr:tRNA (adenosine(37)-N6)-threonylcarbamoyltransferase complex dimerization subunit type 1 TsaB [Nonlabens sp. Hel1_33_55]SCY30324.1 tRNA threonylcarbamoyladenosine biosynthesis protein TsaB [Nonlabens sp. Hel1_33_55]